MHRVIAETDIENAASRITLERAGFRLEATLIENVWLRGAYASECHYAMLDREWKAMNTK